MTDGWRPAPPGGRSSSSGPRAPGSGTSTVASSSTSSVASAPSTTATPTPRSWRRSERSSTGTSTSASHCPPTSPTSTCAGCSASATRASSTRRRSCSTRAPKRSRTRSRSPRYSTGRDAIVCLDNAFHGRTLLTMSLTAKVRPYKLGFGPFAPEIYRAPGPYPYPRRLVRRRDRRTAPAVHEPGRPVQRGCDHLRTRSG